MKPLFLGVLALAMFITVFPSQATAEYCPELTTMVLGKTFVAKKPLYDTKIAQEGIVKLERDKQEIPEGAPFTVLSVDCDGQRIKLRLRQNASYKLEKVKVKFLFTRAQRELPNAEEIFEKMLDYVFEDPEKSAKPEE